MRVQEGARTVGGARMASGRAKAIGGAGCRLKGTHWLAQCDPVRQPVASTLRTSVLTPRPQTKHPCPIGLDAPSASPFCSPLPPGPGRTALRSLAILVMALLAAWSCLLSGAACPTAALSCFTCVSGPTGKGAAPSRQG